MSLYSRLFESDETSRGAERARLKSPTDKMAKSRHIADLVRKGEWRKSSSAPLNINKPLPINHIKSRPWAFGTHEGEMGSDNFYRVRPETPEWNKQRNINQKMGDERDASKKSGETISFARHKVMGLLRDRLQARNYILNKRGDRSQPDREHSDTTLDSSMLQHHADLKKQLKQAQAERKIKGESSISLFNRLFETFKDTEDGINEKGWDRAMGKLPKEKSKGYSTEITPNSRVKNIFSTHKNAIKTNRAINKLKVMEKQ